MYKLIVVIGVVAASCVVLLGCGSSGDETASGDEPASAGITKAQFIRGAEKICANMAKDQEAALQAWSKSFPGNDKEAQELFKHVYGKIIAPFMHRLAVELDALGAPKGDEADVSAMTDGLRKASRALEERDSADVKHYLLYTFKRNAFAYGLKTCPAL